MLNQWRTIGAWVLHALLALPRLWKYNFKDFRIIVEQDGNLRYFRTPASLQRAMARIAITVFVGAAMALVGLGATSLALNSAKSRLEMSHREIYAMLLGDADPADSSGKSPTELAQLVRDRQEAIQKLIGLSALAFQDENQSLAEQLHATGLSQRAIHAIERASIGGGAMLPEGSPFSNGLLPDSLVNDILRNRDLQEVLRALPEQMPLKQYEISSGYGIRKHPLTGNVHFHEGVDLVGSGQRNKVYAAKQGKVTFAEEHPQLGNTVVLQHGHDIKTLYAHLAEINVQVGEAVGLDTILGTVGNTGLSTGPHLHFSVLVGNFATDPIKVMRAAKNVQQIKS
jgi:murein DD-endopeptidase MepM/ murein hydrolase activator NlpD